MLIREDLTSLTHSYEVLKWSFVAITVLLGTFSIFQISSRVAGAYYFSSDNEIRRFLSERGVLVEKIDLQWSGLNPVLRAEKLQYTSANLRGVLLELDFLGSLIENQIVLRRLQIRGGQVPMQFGFGGGPLNDFLIDQLPRIILSTDDLSVDFEFLIGEMPNSENSLDVRLFSVYEEGRNKTRLSLSNVLADGEAFNFSVDKLAKSWMEIGNDYLITAKGYLSVPDIFKGFEARSIEVRNARWFGNLEGGRGVLDFSIKGLKPKETALSIEAAATIQLTGFKGKLDGRLSKFVMTGLEKTVEFEPILFNYNGFLARTNFDGLDQWLSNNVFLKKLAFHSLSLDLGELSEFLISTYPDWNAVDTWLSNLKIRGTLSEIHGYIDEELNIGLLASLENSSLAAYRGIPSLDDLNAIVVGYNNGVLLEIVSSKLAVSFPKLFTDTWYLGQINGSLEAWFNDSYFSLVSSEITATMPNIEVKGHFSLSRPKDQRYQSLSMIFGAEGLRVQDRNDFVPHALAASLRDWLGVSLIGGSLQDLRFAYNGHTKFGDNRSSKRIELQTFFENIRVDYMPDWPSVFGANGEFHLKGLTTHIQIEEAKTLDIKGVSGNVRINNEELQLQSDLSFTGSSQSIFSFIRESPIREELDFFAEDWRGAGDVTAELDFAFALNDFDVDGLSLSIDFGLDDFGLNIPGYGLDFKSLNGEGIFLFPSYLNGSFKGDLLEHPVSIEVRSNSEKVEFIFEGVADAETVSSLGDPLVEPYIDGEFGYTALMEFRISDIGSSRLEIESDLSGLWIGLPDPLGKIKDETRLTTLVIEFEEGQQSVFYRYGEDEARLTIIDGSVVRGSIGFSDNAIDVDDNRLVLTGSIDLLDVGDYLDQPELQRATGLEIDWQVKNLSVKKILFNGYSWAEVLIDGSGDSSSFRFDINSEDLNGSISMKDPSLLDINLENIQLPLNKLSVFEKAKTTNTSPKDMFTDLPDIVFNVENARYEEERFGSWNFVVRQVEDKVEFHPLSFALKGISVSEAFLSWDVGKGVSDFRGSLFVDDLEATLPKWGFPGSIMTESTRADFDLKWAGSPLGIELEGINGVAQVQLGKGRFKEISSAEGGFKIASLLNFSTILGRISKFDFSDVRGRGVGFESLSANVSLDGGSVTFSEPMTVVSTSSRMELGGTMNLLNNTLDSELTITLPVSESLPWYAAYLAVVNPIAGLGVIVGERVFRKPIEKFSTGKFLVTGSISDPAITFKGLWDKDVKISKVVAPEGPIED